MSLKHAERFLAKMASDAELKATITTEYRAMLCAIARREGFDVSAEELRTALLQEQCSLTDNWRAKSGSSPRVRGADDVCARVVVGHRIIPARAGSSDW